MNIKELHDQCINAKVKFIRHGINLICPVCQNSVVRKWLIVGPQECINSSCITNKPHLISKKMNFKQRVVVCQILKKMLLGD